MGTILGTLSGAAANQKEGGKDTGNIFGASGMPGMLGQAEGNVSGAMTDANWLSGYAVPGSQYSDAAGDLQSNPLTGQIYGQGGVLSNAIGQQNDLAKQGFNLTDADKTAYGEASGNIARQFGQADQGLAQSLSDRGLSDSGVAGAAFTGSQGNKNEQLAGLQNQIAQNRMQMNQQRLAQTQNFLGQLTGQTNQAMQGRVQQGIQGAQLQQQQAQTKYNMGMGIMGAYQNQQNEGLQQQQQTQHASGLSNALSGAQAGMSSDIAAATGVMKAMA